MIEDMKKELIAIGVSIEDINLLFQCKQIIIDAKSKINEILERYKDNMDKYDTDKYDSSF